MKELSASSIDAQIRKRFRRCVVSTVFMVAVTWVLAAVEAFTGIRPFRYPNPDPAELQLPAMLMFYGAITVVLIVLGALWYWRERSVLSRGIVVMAEVVECEAVGFSGIPATKIRYTVDGKEINSSLLVGDKEAKLLEVGSHINIIVDARNPKRCTIAS